MQSTGGNSVYPMPGSMSRPLGTGCLGSSDGGQDPIDAAIRTAAAKKVASDLPKLIKFTPFDSGTKMSEAMAVNSIGDTVRIVKGAFATVASLLQPALRRLKLKRNLKNKDIAFWPLQPVHQ